jgi:quercetin dioxygenase-like cupin family protein
VVLVHQADAEVVGGPPVTGRLYADSSATGGALSSQRITLQQGAAGATPHHHTGSSELFYVISGAAEMLTGERVHTVAEGDLVVVPPGTVPAFAAARDNDADLLIILTPGVERFEYFRQLQRIAAGQAPLESILQTQGLYDKPLRRQPGLATGTHRPPVTRADPGTAGTPAVFPLMRGAGAMPVAEGAVQVR